MDTEQLEKYMKADKWITEIYGGVFPKDLLPHSPERPSLFIVNLDKSDQPGSHWVVVFVVDRKISEYFDPLGKVPDTDFKNYLTQQSRSYRYSDKRCQNYASNICGQYCLFYCYFRARGYSMQHILNMFDENNLLYNDQLVYYFYEYTN